MKEFINLHQHTHFSNASMMEVVSKPNDYIQYALDNNMSAVSFTEHGSILSWVAKKMAIEKAGLKYIHGIEAYLTESLDEKLRDNYHLILLAKNYEGVKEINRLSSTSYNGRGDSESDDIHFYYSPRISFEELSNTSDNILILTSCLGSPLWQNYKSNQKDQLKKWSNFFVANKHRVWLEVQPHDHKEQKIYNQWLLDLARENDMKIVATNDVHAVSQKHDVLRKILMKSKGVVFENDGEEDFELWSKNYDEMFETFTKQGILSDDEIAQSLDETINIVNSIEEFEFDYSFKYPKLYDDSENIFKEKIVNGYIAKGLNKLPDDLQRTYKDRVNKELAVYKKLNSVDFMLLMEYIDMAARNDNRFPGYARGSVSGSLIAYLLEIIEVDPIKEDLSFERFQNVSRVNLSDIDTDFFSEDREWVTKFLLTNDNFNCSAIVTYNTLGIKGAIKDVGRALGYNPQEMNVITKNLPEDEKKKSCIPDSVRKEYPELSNIAEKVVGVITSVSRHAGGFIVTSRPLEEELGTIHVGDSPYAVSSVAMREVEGLFYVKMDILGVDNVGLVNKTCELAGIPRATPQSDNIDFNDIEVMKDIARDTTAIFQMEGQRAQKLLSTMFSDTTMDRMKKTGVNTDSINQLALLNAAMRPGAASVIDDISNGIAKDNGHEALNLLLKDTLGYLIYQESQIQFLVEFCGRTASEADLIRRAIGHKEPEVLAVEIPKIKLEFIETMVEKHGDTQEHAELIIEDFIQIFQDAANYSFSRNHAIPYSYIGYISGWLRYYYPLEFCTVALEIWKDDQEKTNRLTNYAEKKGITIESPKFRYSRGDYFFDKETNTIYQGTAPIKDNNAKTGDMLYSLRKGRYNNFVDFLVMLRENTTLTTKDKTFTILDLLNMSEDDVKQLDKDIKLNDKNGGDEFVIETSSLSINKTKMLSLIRLNYFREFGKNEKLEKVFDAFNTSYKPKNKTYSGKHKKYVELTELEKTLEDTRLPLFDQCSWELYYKGKISVIDDSIPPQYAFVTEINKGKTRTSATVYNINKGVNAPIKVGAKLYRNINFDVGDMVQILKTKSIAKSVKVDGVWGKHPTEKELWIEDMKSIRKGIQK